MNCIMAVVGSRNFTDRELIYQWIAMNMPDKIVSGGARGADSIAEEIAFQLDIPFESYLPEWRRYGKAAAFIRNQKIVNAATELAAFFGPQGPTAGTSDAIALARLRNIPVHVFSQEQS